MSRCNYILTPAQALTFFAQSDSGFVLERVPSPHPLLPPSGQLFMVCRNRVTEALVGLSEDLTSRKNVSWELLGDEDIFGRSYMILEGWGDAQSGGNTQFESYRIGIEHAEMLAVLRNLTRMHPDLFNAENYAQTDGLEAYAALF